jgi:ubiquinone/menaquinone biosynthesis C-methylase UbiE
MSDIYFFRITKIIKRVFIYPHNTNKVLQKLWKSAASGKIEEEEAMRQFVAILAKFKKMPTKQLSDSYKSASTLELLGDFRPKSILDIGAGEGIIAQSVGESYGLDKESIFAIDLQKIDNNHVTVLEYVDGKIPLPDKSVDLVILMSVLHHIDPHNRMKVMAEVQRVLSDNGRVFIREHDDNAKYEFRIFLQFVHYVWYTVYNENEDPLYLMTKKYLVELFEDYGMTVDNEKSTDNPQRIYECVFKKSTIE